MEAFELPTVTVNGKHSGHLGLQKVPVSEGCIIRGLPIGITLTAASELALLFSLAVVIGLFGDTGGLTVALNPELHPQSIRFFETKSVSY